MEHIERTYADSGWFVVTNKSLYFAGSHKSLRLPFTKIISFQPMDEGIGVIKDGANSQPQIFINADGWFSYNMIVNLAKL